MSGIRKEPCSSCPYRCDVPSGIWSEAEYDKLPLYDEETYNQPPFVFVCHATPEWLCHGWVVVHGEGLLALRIWFTDHPDVRWELPEAVMPMFPSGTHAAVHGKAELRKPGPEAVTLARRLLRKHGHLEVDGG